MLQLWVHEKAHLQDYLREQNANNWSLWPQYRLTMLHVSSSLCHLKLCNARWIPPASCALHFWIPSSWLAALLAYTSSVLNP